MAGRTRTEQRNQLVLNFGRRDVVEWAGEWLDDLVASAEVDFIKWDMNRAFTEAGWPGAEDPGRLWFDHTTGVYEVMDRLRASHPALRIESCASGGGRADFGVLRRTDQVWTSDNADPVDRLAIQHGFSQIYPAIVMGAWATASPNPITGRETPLRFRMHSAMAGALGVSGDLRKWSPEDLAEARELIRAYQRIRPLIAFGEAHRLRTDQAMTALEHVAHDRSAAVVLAFRPSPQYGEPDTPLRLRGLDPEASYRDEDGVVHSGAVLMAYGIDVGSRMPSGDYASAMIHLERA
jgi:alpha-galactosidase